MTILGSIVMVYAVVVTFFLAYLYQKRDPSVLSRDDIKNLILLSKTPKDKAEIISAIAEYCGSIRPWYENALSTIGVVALFTMILATAVQTVRFAAQEYRIELADSRLQETNKRIVTAEKVIVSISDSLREDALQKVRLSESEGSVLRYRQSQLKERSDLSKHETDELYEISLALRDYSSASELVERNIELLDSTDASDQVTLAEYYFLVGSHKRAQSLAGEAWRKRIGLALSTRKRLFVIYVLTGHDRDKVEEELAGILKINREAAGTLLNRRIDDFGIGMTRQKDDR